eukprot:11320697-Alexandrium_andersonii.AAC.1
MLATAKRSLSRQLSSRLRSRRARAWTSVAPSRSCSQSSFWDPASPLRISVCCSRCFLSNGSGMLTTACGVARGESGGFEAPDDASEGGSDSVPPRSSSQAAQPRIPTQHE